MLVASVHVDHGVRIAFVRCAPVSLERLLVTTGDTLAIVVAVAQVEHSRLRGPVRCALPPRDACCQRTNPVLHSRSRDPSHLWRTYCLCPRRAAAMRPPAGNLAHPSGVISASDAPEPLHCVLEGSPNTISE